MKKRVQIDYLLRFVLSVILFGVISLLLLRGTMTISFLNYGLNKSDYIHNLSSEVKSDMENYMIQSGLPNEILNNVFSEQDVKDDTMKLLNKIVNDENVTFTSEKLETNLKNNISNYASENGVVVDVNSQEMQNFVKQMSDVYQTDVLIKHNNLGIHKYLLIMDYLIIGGILLFIGVLIALQKNKHSKNSGIVLMTNMFLFIAVDVYLKKMVNINNMFFLSNSFTGLINTLYAMFLNMLIGVIGILFGLILIIYIKKLIKK
jgi:membrane-associated HD superfamily phosphohydrolase